MTLKILLTKKLHQMELQMVNRNLSLSGTGIETVAEETKASTCKPFIEANTVENSLEEIKEKHVNT